MGPILPQLQVYGKELGISAVIMGTVTGILPITFLFSKFAFGMLVDAFRTYRKTIFMGLIAVMTISYAALYFVPATFFSTYEIKNATDNSLRICNTSDIFQADQCHSHIRRMTCSCNNSRNVTLKGLINLQLESDVCTLFSYTLPSDGSCSLECQEDFELEQMKSCQFDASFWIFILLMSTGTILYNVINSISDAICFDVIGEEYDYGQQRVWGTIGWGIAAIVSGFFVDWWSPGAAKSYTPAFLIMIIFTIFDIVSCVKLKLPGIEPPTNILEDLRLLASQKHTVVFLIFAAISGVLDGFLIYFLLWYLEDLALEAQTTNVKLLEGLVIAAETLGTEILFFAIAGKILDKIGHANCLSLCFLFYAIRNALISLVSSPWWLVPIEFIMQGPTYALTYSTIVGFANVISPPGMSATTQGIAAGLDEGIGYAVGSILGGFLYKNYGGRISFQLFALGSLSCSIIHFLVHKFYVKDQQKESQYKPPSEAVAATDSAK